MNQKSVRNLLEIIRNRQKSSQIFVEVVQHQEHDRKHRNFIKINLQIRWAPFGQKSVRNRQKSLISWRMSFSKVAYTKTLSKTMQTHSKPITKPIAPNLSEIGQKSVRNRSEIGGNVRNRSEMIRCKRNRK